MSDSAARHLGELAAIISDVAAPMPRDELLQRLLAYLIRRLPAARGFILLHPTVVLHAHRHTVVTLSRGLQLVVASALDSEGRPVHGMTSVIDHALVRAALEGRAVTSPALARSEETRAALCAPLAYGGNIFGVLYLDDATGATFDGDDVSLAEILAAVISLVSDQLRYGRMQVEQRVLQEMTADLSSVDTDRGIADRLFPRMIARLGFSEVALLLFQPETGRLRFSFARGPRCAGPPPSLSRPRWRPREGRRAAFSIGLTEDDPLLHRLRTQPRPVLLTGVRRAGSAGMEVTIDGTQARLRSRDLIAVLRCLGYPSCVLATCVVQETLLGLLVARRGVDPAEPDRQFVGFVSTLVASALARVQKYTNMGAQLVRANAELRELAARVDLREQEVQQSFFVLDLGHAIGNPVSVILPRLDILRRDIQRLKNGQAASAEVIEESLRMMREEVLRLEAIRQSLSKPLERYFQPASNDIRDCLKLASDFTGLLHPEISLLVEDQEVPRFFFDLPMVTSALKHLCLNGAQATRDRLEPELRIRLCQREECSEPWVFISVSDNGRGMDEQELARLRSGEESRWSQRPQGGGGGMGLRFCRRVAEVHEGTFNIIDSALGVGTTIELGLPLRRSATTASTEGERAP